MSNGVLLVYPTYLWSYSSFFTKLLVQVIIYLLSFTSLPSPNPELLLLFLHTAVGGRERTSIGLVPK